LAVIGHRQVGHRGRSAGQSLGAPETYGEMRDLQRIEEGERLLLATLEVELEGRAGAGTVTAIDVGLTRALLEEAEVANLLDLRVLAQEVAHARRILARLAHPQFERFEAPQQHPGGVRVANGPDRVPHRAHLVDQLLLADEPARDEVTVAAGIFRQTVDRKVGAARERLRP